ncbi:hypothetical protein Pint_29340 [Pistacia integerrima]|uniref:Uncharacterized protein n=1 Tax=Pistacia integerrima TaxID=434235 RepID=A0ACC0X1T3_9ROSI|nr:hypothetical protein Pint_29340 [Pistacia integerrima]
MDVPKQSSDRFCFLELYHACSCKSCSFFVSIFLLFIVIIVGVATLCVIFVIKPQKPIFSLESLKVVSFDLKTSSNSTLFVSSVAILILNAQNPNKLGIKYSPSWLHLYFEGLPVGLIGVPGFNQPAHSNNTDVVMGALIHCLNITDIISGRLSQDKSTYNVLPMRLLGDISVQLQLFHLTMPKIKVSLDCDINLDYSKISFVNEINTIRLAQNYTASFPADSKSFFNKCNMAIYI